MVAFSLTSGLDADVVVLDEVDSTNRFLRDTPGTDSRIQVAVTTHQTAGRGRMDRVWVCRPGDSLALSVAIPPPALPEPLTPDLLHLVALASGSVVAEAIAPHADADVRVKWPNDVLVGGKKVAGILGEVAPDRRIIVGVGLNLNVPEGDLPTPIATSLHLHSRGRVVDADRVTHDIVTGFLHLIPHLGSRLTGSIRDRVIARLDTLGRRVRVEYPDGKNLVGTATALTDEGALVISPDDRSGEVVVTAGDIWHLRLPSDYRA